MKAVRDIIANRQIKSLESFPDLSPLWVADLCTNTAVKPVLYLFRRRRKPVYPRKMSGGSCLPNVDLAVAGYNLRKARFPSRT